MSYSLGDIKGTQFKVDTSQKGDTVIVTVGKGEYFFSPADALIFATALQYFSMCAEETSKWTD